jgi:phosphoribosyl-ATP pyrophosphohydrolase
MATPLDRLEATIRARRNGDPAASYVARLTADGRARMARKVGEEAIETLVAALSDDRAATTSEAADLIFHLLVLLADMDLSFDDVMAELDRREGLSGLAEKAARSGDA